jgi:hypothetical protein
MTSAAVASNHAVSLVSILGIPNLPSVRWVYRFHRVVRHAPCRSGRLSSAFAAPGSAGIPLTHRGMASSFAVVTATLADGEAKDLRAVAAAVDTLVVLMAAARLEEVCAEAIAAGRPPSAPAAVIEHATTARQRTVVATLGTLPSMARAQGIGPPATLVVGEVVRTAEVLGTSSASDGRAPWNTVQRRLVADASAPTPFLRRS